jgi:hypothetical protein
LRLRDRGTVELDRRLINSLGDDGANAVAELVRQAVRPIVRRQRLSNEMKQDIEELEEAVRVLTEL